MTHPLLVTAGDLHAALSGAAEVNPVFMSADDKAAALRELTAVATRVAELKLRVLATADDVAEQTAARDAAGWLAHEVRARPEDCRAERHLARALDLRYGVLREALALGHANTAQAAVIVRCLDELPPEVPADVLERAEKTLVAHCADFDPAQLRRLGTHVIEVVAPEIVEEAEARRLAELESSARRATRLTMRRLGDGTTRLSGRLPDAAASRLATYLESFSSPRQPGERESGGDPVARLAYPRRIGEAFCRFLEVVDTASLPVHGGDATTVIVTMSLDSLRRDLGVGTLQASDIPGDEPAAGSLSAGEVRRLACSARIVPAVLGGASEVLDLGRARRLFSPAQRKALTVRDATCRAEGCDVPGTWSEAHHWVPWQAGGLTDLDNAVLLCSHHHHRAHDAAFSSERMPNGDVRFTRRT